jgi:hypothetical protein
MGSGQHGAGKKYTGKKSKNFRITQANIDARIFTNATGHNCNLDPYVYQQRSSLKSYQILISEHNIFIGDICVNCNDVPRHVMGLYK